MGETLSRILWAFLAVSITAPKPLGLDRHHTGHYAGWMPDLVPEDRIKGKERYLRDLQPGESIKVHPAAFSVTPEKYLAILKSLQLDRPAFQLKTMNSSELGRDADVRGTWICA